MEIPSPPSSPFQVMGEFEMMAGTVEEEGLEVVRKVSVGWRVEWSEEKYMIEVDSVAASIVGKDVVRSN